MICTATLAALMLAGCGMPADAGAHTPNSFDAVALNLGFARGVELQGAGACSPGPPQRRAERDRVPAGFTPRDSEAYRHGLELGLAQGRQAQGKCYATGTPRLRPDGHAQPPIRTGSRSPSYCAQGGRLAQAAGDLRAQLQAIADTCRPGDTVTLPVDASDVIASVCDLSRPVASAGRNAYCTVGIVRPTRASQS